MAVSRYATALALGRPKPDYVVNEADNDRVTAYNTYADIYNNAADTWTAVLREEDDPKSRRYVPTARTIIEAANRFLAKGFEWAATIPADVTMDEAARDAQMAFLQATMTREEFDAKFLAMKRWMLIKGDGLFHISADPLKEEGKRIRITEVEPEEYFPIADAADAEKVIGCYLVSILVNDQDKVAQRTEYRRILNDEMASEFKGAIGQVFFRIGFYEIDGWDDRLPATPGDLKPVGVPAWIPTTEALDLQMAGFVLPAEIQAVPVYHFRNRRKGREPFGTSELQGTESVLAGVIQNATDEDMAVALMGIGMYVTDSGHPIDPVTGQELEWEIAPASVVEVQQGGKFDRVEGVSSVTPVQDHVNFLTRSVRETTGTPDIAVGTIDVSVAESGIARAIAMAPMTAKNEETEVELAAKLDQMVYDLLNGWFPAFESQPVTGLVVTAVFGDPLPIDRKEVIDEISALVTAKIVDAEFAREYLSQRLGFRFPADMTERMASAEATALDAAGARMDAALAGEGA